jgi:hypothetical protein
MAYEMTSLGRGPLGRQREQDRGLAAPDLRGKVMLPDGQDALPGYRPGEGVEQWRGRGTRVQVGNAVRHRQQEVYSAAHQPVAVHAEPPRPVRRTSLMTLMGISPSDGQDSPG